MIPALILVAVIVGVGAMLYVHHRLTYGRGTRSDEGAATAAPEGDPEAAATAEGGEECCGMHVTCEKDSLLAGISSTIEYYDDEELDRFAGREAEDYDEAESEEFREVMLTMRPEEIAGWARSLQLRGITLPADVRDELLLIVSERRAELSGSQP